MMNENQRTFETGDALLVIDVQNDFCPGGKLAINEGDAVIPVLNGWIDSAEAANIPVYASRDFHPVDHISFHEQGGLWPPHCLQDSEGAAFHRDLNLPDHAAIVTKGVRFDMDQNSAFCQTGITFHLRKNGIKRIFIGGLALDVCVLESAMDAINEENGFDVVLIKDATRPVNPKDGEKALAKMKTAGIRIIEQSALSDLEYCQRAPEWAEHARLNEFTDACDDGRTGKI
jgi:nicotinamidase/pyrazinamidase